MLCADARIRSVTGIDASPVHLADGKFSSAVIDIRTEHLSTSVLEQFDALVHLGTVAYPTRMSTREMFDINVRAPQKLFGQARDAGVRRLVLMSTAFVYGTAVHANEQAPAVPLAGFLYAEHLAHLEQLLAIEVPDCVRLRPHMVLGPKAHPAWRHLLRQPFYPRLPFPQPLLQCVHEDDVARAVLLCLFGASRGAYNLATEESFSARDAIKGRGFVHIGIPLNIARAGLNVAARLGHWGADPGFARALTQTLLINSRRAIIELGWRSHYSAQAALEST